MKTSRGTVYKRKKIEGIERTEKEKEKEKEKKKTKQQASTPRAKVDNSDRTEIQCNQCKNWGTTRQLQDVGGVSQGNAMGTAQHEKGNSTSESSMTGMNRQTFDSGMITADLWITHDGMLAMR